MFTKKEENEENIFFCKKCNYNAKNRWNYNRHVLTRKHKIPRFDLHNTYKNEEKEENKISIVTDKYKCNCGSVYKHRQSLYAHSKYCKYNENNTDLINYLLKENKELKNMVIDVCKNTNSHNITNNITHNKTFNLNLFLNEECKDAMNIKDFVDSIQLQLSDLEHVGKVGYINGISSIIINRLKDLDVCKRPVHCSDFKRETMYVKDENKWEKENEQKEKLRKVIKEISNKNTKVLSKFKQKYPESNHIHSKKSDEYNELIIESLGGKNDDDDNHIKIIKKIAKQVTIDK